MLNKIKTYFNRTKKISFTESTRPLLNPGCGWYQIYSFNLAEESPLYIACEEEQLVLLRIDIQAYRTTNQIPDKARDRLDQILSFFSEHDKGIILRIVYDTDGHGMEHEPASIGIVKSHMTQLGSMISRHKGEVLVHQGIFVGSWGEMHSSKFLDTAHMTELVQTLYEAIGGICPIAVRKPVQFRSIIAQNQQIPLTLFNDGIFGSETDLGTYSSRKDELDWQKAQMQRRFTGGEVIGILDNINANSLAPNLMISELAQMHLSYLNSTYRQEQLDAWKNQSMTWNGKTISVYDYIGRHLGYRFTVTNVKLASQSTIQITIRNTGFANLYEEAECKLLLVSPQIVEQSTQMPKQKIQQEITLNCDPCAWDSGRNAIIECDIPVENCDLYLQLTRKRDGRPITFANENTDVQYGIFLFRQHSSLGVSAR